MANRKKIGLVFNYSNVSNSGIVNYLFSFVKALNTLDDLMKPHLVIFYTKQSPISLIREENYPYITYKRSDLTFLYSNILTRLINKVARYLFKKNLICRREFTSKDADYIFPFGDSFSGIKNKVNWLVDFSPYYILDHLTKEQRDGYFSYVKRVVYESNKVVLSSYTIFEDLKKFYPDYRCKVEILRFASLLPPFDHINIDNVKRKFDISRPYIMTPNQFWVHKNHFVILKAARALKSFGLNLQIVFTGSTKVEGESDYYHSILQYIRDNNLDDYIRILGVIDRAEQLALMKSSVVLVQPSLFEGWSTLVEESKALNKHILLSDIPVHREQIDINCTFFNPNNENELASIIENGLKSNFPTVVYDYNIDIGRYATRITEIFS